VTAYHKDISKPKHPTCGVFSDDTEVDDIHKKASKKFSGFGFPNSQHF
jgi:hypothetical protein